MRPPKLRKKRAVLRASDRCTYCGNPDRFEFTVDHRLPRSRGGDNSMENLCVACFRCNCAKDDMTDVEFITYANMVGWPWLQRKGKANADARRYARRRRHDVLSIEFNRLHHNDRKRAARAVRANSHAIVVGC